MMIRSLRISVGILLVLGMPVAASASWFGADFTADVVHQMAAQQQQGKMYVGHGKVRTEMHGTRGMMVEIIDPTNSSILLLDPQQMRYQQVPIPLQVNMDRSQRGNPCAMLPQASCQQNGSEVVNGRKAVRWQIAMDDQQATQWIDDEHRFAVRMAVNGDVQMEMRYQAGEQLNDRKVERWTTHYFTPQGEVVATQWYDPQLNVAIRQQMPDGSQRELRNIRLGTPAASLFELPANYRLMTPQ